MKAKVDNQLEAVANNPQLLSRFMLQLMTFDETVRRRFNYDGGNPDLGWKGLTWEVLDQWFDTWYEVEKKFALERYWDINKSPDSTVIDHDGSGPGKTKPTYGAIKVTDLIQTETLQYNKLRKFSHKMKFLIGIQAEILDLYYGRLKDSLDVYSTLTSTVGRTIHGITKEQEAALQGVGKLETLCKVFGSAEHLISMMKDWSNEEVSICVLAKTPLLLYLTLINIVLHRHVGRSAGESKRYRQQCQACRRNVLQRSQRQYIRRYGL